MRKIILIVAILSFQLSLFSLIINEENYDFELIERGEYSTFRINQDVIYSQITGAPAIPLKSVFIQLPEGKKINSVNVIPQDYETIQLSKQLLPVQRAFPLSYDKRVTFQEPIEQFYDTEVYPENQVFNFGSGQLGNTSIGYISFYSYRYFPKEFKIEIPENFKIEIEFEDDLNFEYYPGNYITNEILESLGISNREEEEIKYLIITPQDFFTCYEELLNWRYIQGVETYIETVENIENNYTGIDLQEKIRNFIIDIYETQVISFVTLGADVAYIPDRKFFAFDCEYGSYDDENDIPSDMYYSCLNGNWDANGNGIYGEDEDEPDYFPELFISRIPVVNVGEVEDYISRLIDYEKGIHPEYNKAGGFSMELWENSNSEICQHYIYDNYFPDYYEINFIFGEENTMENAYAVLNENQNIVQHTGHANRNALALEYGHILNSNIHLLNNDYGGIFYSIGCWSAAIDYNSIGENLVSSIGKGQLGFIGNSRYGWGAPSAPGFGFSEFFQKEFFKIIFWNGKTIVSEVNTLQKIPFIPYFSGTSVYKWIAYQLNALGDSYFNLFKDNPDEFDYTASIVVDSLHFVIYCDNIPVENVVITINDFQVRTDVNGEAKINAIGLEGTCFIYKYGYRTINFDITELIYEPLIGNISGIEEDGYLQGEELTITSTFYNPTFQQFDFYVEYEYNSDQVEVTSYENPENILDFSQVDLSPLDIRIKSTEETCQFPDGYEIIVEEKIYNQEDDELITQAAFVIKIKSPELIITSIQFEENSIEPGIEIPMSFTVTNNGSVAASGLVCNFSSDSDYITFEDDSFALFLYLPEGESTELSNIIYLSESAPEEFLGNFMIELLTSNNEQNYSFSKTFYLPVGEIGIFDDFEGELNWNFVTAWQTVGTYFYSEDHSFSCRPEFVGNYTAESPGFIYLPEMQLSFWYKYKMPMYGEDGVYFIMEYENEVDTLLFLGAGGALPADSDRDPLVYIESDWAEYIINLDETLIEDPDPGTTFTIKLIFKFAQEYEGFNQYATMDDIGIFIDDFCLNFVASNTSEEQEAEPEDYYFAVFPNPVCSNDFLNISFYISGASKVSASIYNIKGQLVQKIHNGNMGKGIQTLLWDGKDIYNRRVKSGIYFIKIDLGSKVISKKLLLIK